MAQVVPGCDATEREWTKLSKTAVIAEKMVALWKTHSCLNQVKSLLFERGVVPECLLGASNAVERQIAEHAHIEKGKDVSALLHVLVLSTRRRATWFEVPSRPVVVCTVDMLVCLFLARNHLLDCWVSEPYQLHAIGSVFWQLSLACPLQTIATL